MNFVRAIYASMASRQIAFLLKRGRTTNEAITLTSLAISMAMGSNILTVAVLLGLRPSARLDRISLVIAFSIALTLLQRVNEKLIRRWVDGPCDLVPAQRPSLLMALYMLFSIALMFIVMYQMLWPK